MIQLNFKRLDINHFPDNSLHLKIGNSFYCMSENTITWNYKDDSELFTLITLKKLLDEKVALEGNKNKISLNLPYIPHARMDRVEDDETGFTLKAFCDVINWLHFDAVYVTDPHSNVAVALLNNCVPVYTSDRIIDDIADFMHNKENIVLFYPDEGALKRYTKYIEGYPYTFGIKHRNWETGKITSYKVAEPEVVKDKDILIVDDICSKGGTFIHAADALAEAGAASIRLYVTHLEAIALRGKLFDKNSLIKHIYTRHTLDVDDYPELMGNPKVTYI